MVLCTDFSSNIDCVLTLQNEYNVKLILLLGILGYILFSLWYMREEVSSDEHFSMLKYFSLKIFPTILLVFFPFLLLMLKINVPLELVISTLTWIYFIVLGLFIGLSLLFGKEFIFKILGDRREIRSRFKYMKK